MAKHSLGGLRSLDTIRAPDREVTRLSPNQSWILRYALRDPSAWHGLPPSRDFRRSAEKLVARGLLYARAGMEVKYRPVGASGESHAHVGALLDFGGAGVTRKRSSHYSAS